MEQDVGNHEPVMNRCSITSWLLLVSITAPGPVIAAQPPNVILFLADDMGMGDTSAYQDWTGNPDADQLQTPAIDRLARRGVRFTAAHAPHSRCTATRYALMTGRYCWRTRLKHYVLFGVHADPLIDRQRITLPEFLQAAGYRTGMVGKWHLGLTYRRRDGAVAAGWSEADLRQPLADAPIDHGFDFFHGISRSHPTSGPGGLDRTNGPTQRVGPGWIEGRNVIGATDNGKELVHGSYDYWQIGERLDQQALAFLAAGTGSGKPFFLYFASPANHSPYTPSKQIGDHPIAGASRYRDGTPTRSQRHDFVYQNDVHVSRLIDYLTTTDDPRRPGKPLLENTLFIFTSDNGAEQNDKRYTGPLRSNKGSVYEGGHRVPFIISWPAGGIGDGNEATQGQTRESLLGLNDLYATLAQILDRPLPPVSGPGRGAEDSIGQLPAILGEENYRRGAIYLNDHKQASKQLSNKRAWVAVCSDDVPIAGRWKLLLDQRYAFNQQIHPQELYNLADDPREQHDRFDDPDSQAVIEFLTAQAQRAAGDDGFTRSTSSTVD